MFSEFLTWEKQEFINHVSIKFCDIEVIKDFGQMKKGEKYNSIVFNHRDGIIEVYKLNYSNLFFIVHVKCIPA